MPPDRRRDEVPRGPAELVEIKKDPRKLGRDQVERMERVVQTFNAGAPMVIDGRLVDLLATRQQFRTTWPISAQLSGARSATGSPS